jgi:hypothetical protein
MEIREQRRRYWCAYEALPDGGSRVVWFCETMIYRHDTQTIDRSWVREISKDEVPPALLGPQPEPDPLGMDDMDVPVITEVKGLEDWKSKRKR